MDLPSFLKEILVVIVLYKKSIEQSIAFKTVVASDYGFLISILIYDNSPNPNLCEGNNIIYKHNPENCGVSNAYNEASIIALNLNKKWMLLLDQDSEVMPSIFSVYQRAVLSNPSLHLFAPVMKGANGITSPFRLLFGKGFAIKKINPGIHSLKNMLIINSGMLISLQAFCKSNGFDDRFPLDLSDVVFLERFRINYPDFFLINASCIHNLSAHGFDHSAHEVLIRFRVFCKAMHVYKRISKNNISRKFVIIPRSIKLFLRYGKFEFLKLGLNIVKP